MGQAYIWSGPSPEVVAIENPEGEIDGDLFWVWISDDRKFVTMNFETWEGQAQRCVASLLATSPDLAGLVVADASPAEGGEALAAIASKLIKFRNINDVDRWFHGTSATRLDKILSEGLRGDLPEAMRVWKVKDAAQGMVFLVSDIHSAGSYAEKAAIGGERIIIEIEAASLDPLMLRADRDFPLLTEGNAFKAGAYGNISEVSASFHFTGCIGHAGSIQASSVVAIHRRQMNGGWSRETVERAVALGSGP